MKKFNVFRENITTKKKEIIAENKNGKSTDAIIYFAAMRNEDIDIIFYAEEIENETN